MSEWTTFMHVAAAAIVVAGCLSLWVNRLLIGPQRDLIETQREVIKQLEAARPSPFTASSG